MRFVLWSIAVLALTLIASLTHAQSTGDYILTRKSSSGFDKVIVNPGTNRFLLFDEDGIATSYDRNNLVIAGRTINGYELNDNVVISASDLTTGTLADARIASALTGKSYNGMTITSNSGTLHIANAKAFDVLHTITLDGNDGSTLNIGSGGTLAASAFTDALNASNISSGTLDIARIADGSITTAKLASTPAVLAANTFTRGQTITESTANEAILASTGYSLTGSNATSMIDVAGTWNTTGNPTLIKIAVTNTASGSSAKLLDILGGSAGTTSLFAVTKTGAIDATNQTGQNIFSAAIQCRANFNLYDGSGTWFYVANNGPGKGMYLGSNCYMGFSSATNDAGTTADTFFCRGGAAAMQLGKDSATPTAQTFCAANGSGTNITGASLTIKPGVGTGTGGSGKLIFQTAPVGSSGSTANTATTRVEIDRDGVLLLKECSTIPASNPTAGFYLFVDPADHALKARGASGTVTTLANP